MIIAATGHRPNKLGGYEVEATQKVLALATEVMYVLKPKLVISGMAQGWDMAIAQAAINAHIPFHAYIPFEGQEWVWPSTARLYYKALLSHATHIKLCSRGNYTKAAMQYRNECMVNDCDLLVALWNGSPGGTSNCLKYARLTNRPYINVWSSFLTGEPISTTPVNAFSVASNDWLGPLEAYQKNEELIQEAWSHYDDPTDMG